MTRDDLLKFHETMCDRTRKIMSAKNHDYAGAEGGSPFANFEASEHLGLCSTETGMLVRMLDKLKRLETFTKTGILKVPGESVQDACDDLVNYAILFAARVWDQSSQTRAIYLGQETTAALSEREAHLRGDDIRYRSAPVPPTS